MISFTGYNLKQQTNTMASDQFQDLPIGAEIRGVDRKGRSLCCHGSTSARSFPAVAVGAAALGALAVGAISVGALAVGRMVVGRLLIRLARIGRLEIGTLKVGRLEVVEHLKMPESP